VKARVDSARTTIKQHVRLSLALVGLALAALVLFVPCSAANLSNSSFEGNDGNMIAGGANTDWNNVHGGATALVDKPSGNTDDILRAYVASETVSAADPRRSSTSRGSGQRRTATPTSTSS
jgi:hypothetical protein